MYHERKRTSDAGIKSFPPSNMQQQQQKQKLSDIYSFASHIYRYICIIQL